MFARAHQRAEARSKAARAESEWRAQSKSTWKASSSGALSQLQMLVVVGGVLASACGEVRISDQAGPEPALVGRERGVGDVPGEGAGRAGGEVAPKGVLGGAR